MPVWELTPEVQWAPDLVQFFICTSVTMLIFVVPPWYQNAWNVSVE